jgi:nitroreductase
MTPLAPARMSDSPVSVLEHIVETRRSVYSFLPDPVPRAIVEGAIKLAMLAPNHHRTRPWRFAVYADGGRAPLAAAYEAASTRLGRDVAKARTRALEAPVMIVVSCVPAVNPRIKVWEEEFATAAAVQNMLLAFTAAGVSSLIATGDLAMSDEVAALVKLPAAPARLMCVVSVGYQDTARPLVARPEPDVAAYTTWSMESA